MQRPRQPATQLRRRLPDEGWRSTGIDRAAARAADDRLRTPAAGRDGLWPAARGDGARAREPNERVVLVGIDTLGIRSPEVDELRARVADAAGTDRRRAAQLEPHAHRAARRAARCCARCGAARRPTATSGSSYWAALYERVVASRDGSGAARAGGGRLGHRARSTSRSTGASAAPTATSSTAGARTGSSTARWSSLQAAPARRDARSRRSSATAATRSRSAWTSPATRPTSRAPLRDAVRELDGRRVRLLPGRRRQRPAAHLVRRATSARPSAWASGSRSRRSTALADRDAWPRRIVRALGRLADPDARSSATRTAARARRELRAAEERLDFPLLPLPDVDELAGCGRVRRGCAEAASAGGAAERVTGCCYHAKWARLRSRARRGHARDLGRGLDPRGPDRRRRDRRPRRARSSPRSAWPSRSARPAGRRSTPATRTAPSATSRPPPSTPRAATSPPTRTGATASRAGVARVRAVPRRDGGAARGRASF